MEMHFVKRKKVGDKLIRIQKVVEDLQEKTKESLERNSLCGQD